MYAFNLLKQGEVFGTHSAAATPSATATIANATATIANATATIANATATIANATATPAPADGRLRVMLCGTYPIGQSNGYSRVVYYIAKYLGRKKDIRLTIYGFQNYKQADVAQTRKDIPDDVVLHDALATEDPKRQGFGEKEIGAYLKANPQDIVIIFNDMVITSALVQTINNEISPEERRKFKLVSYMDQVYPYQKKQYIETLNKSFDAVVAFTPYWQSIVRGLGLREDMPTYYFPHGFDPQLYYPIPRKLARLYLGIVPDAFVVLNLNRNQPRKRWDHTIMAWAEVVRRHQDLVKKAQAKGAPAPRPMRLMIATQIVGFWDLLEIYEHELRKRSVNFDVGKEYLASLSRPQQMSDRDINILYSACDIGLNTCEGEGFGLCQFEHAAVGCPQVAANIGGFREFLNAQNSIVLEPKITYYIDKQRDGIGGLAEMSDPQEYADAIWKYYTNPNLVTKHGNRARREITQKYRWEAMVDHFYHNVIKKIA